jgi:hypothetical protein
LLGINVINYLQSNAGLIVCFIPISAMFRGAIHQLLSIILKLRILVLLPVSTMPYVVMILKLENSNLRIDS